GSHPRMPARVRSQRLYAYELDALFKYVDGNVGFLFGDDQRRANANRAGATSQEKHAALESQLDDAVALGGGIFFGGFVFHDFDSEHQASTSNVAYQLQFRRPVCHALEHVIAHLGCVLEQALLLYHVKRSQRGCDTNWIAPKG